MLLGCDDPYARARARTLLGLCCLRSATEAAAVATAAFVTDAVLVREGVKRSQLNDLQASLRWGNRQKAKS